MRGIASVTEQLRGDILDGVYGPGARLVELQLSDRYGCERNVVRLALVELAAEDLVVQEGARGATVCEVSIDEAIEITEARAALESLVVGYAAQHATEELRTELGRIIGQMRRAVTRQRAAAYAELDAELHVRLCDAGRHTTAANLISKLHQRAARQRDLVAAVPGRVEQSLEEHSSIVAAVSAGDAVAARAAMADHLASVIGELRRAR